ncbi:putative membrane protein [Rhodotorula sp. JG-1b]|nr:putative membrane protein [Rhodotorula sp. JG-1b]
MGAVASIPLLGSVLGVGTSAVSAMMTGLVWFCTGQAASALTRSCNCNSSVATRVGFSLIFLANSLLAWTMLSDWAIRHLARYAYDWIKLDCNKCYGVLAVHRICFALAMFHLALSLLLIGVKDTRTKRAAIQNGWWGPKVVIWLVLVYLSFLVPNGFFTSFWATYVSLPGSALFILIGLVLLVDFAHSWSETCLERWEQTDAPLWKWILIGSTLGLYALTIALTAVQYIFFGGKGCGLNTALITINWLVSLALSVLSIAPAVQESNPRSGLAQSGMVVAYTSYLITSAIANHDDTAGRCNPLQSRAAGARTGMVVLGAVFTFLAIAYSTSRAATQSKAFAPGHAGSAKSRANRGADYEALSQHADGSAAAEGSASPMGDLGSEGAIRTAPRKQDSLRWQAIKAAIDEGSLPPSALTEFETQDDSDGEDDETVAGPVNDDERSGTRYNYSFFHVIFVLATMYTACLLTNWSVVSPVTDMDPGQGDDGQPMRIGRSHVAFWMRVISSWVSQALYAWSLGAPLLWPDRFGQYA